MTENGINSLVIPVPLSEVRDNGTHTLATAHSDQLRARTHDEIADDHFECSPVADPAAAVASRCARTAVYFTFCQAVQCFMSYDGGATPASLDTLQIEMPGAWTTSDLGILGAIDKVGMTMTSMMWGRSLQLCPAKLLLCIGLLLNALCTAAFGSLRNKWLMYLAKFIMGSTQSLQGVWGTVWTVTMAPPDVKTMWLGLGGVSAGIGNGLGTAVAGFGTAQGLPYAFAFQLQAAILGGLWVALFLTWPSWLVIKLPRGDRQTSPRSPDALGDQPHYERQPSLNSQLPGNTPARTLYEDDRGAPPSTRQQLFAICRNKVFVFTALQISLIMFEVSGIQFLWVRFFCSVWGLGKNWVTTAYLLIAGGFGGVGIAVGPAYIDKYGGYGSPPGVVASILRLRSFARASALCGMLGLMFVYFKAVRRPDIVDTTQAAGGSDNWLVLLFIVVGLLHLFLQASVPALCGINMEVVHEDMRAFASGVEMTMRNILGFAGGPLVPSLFMSLIAVTRGWDQSNPENEKSMLLYGIGFILFCNVFGLFIMGRAFSEACSALERQRAHARKRLQDAFNRQDLAELERGLAFCRAVELQNDEGSMAVMTAAIEYLGAVRKRSASWSLEPGEHFQNSEGEASFALMKAHAMTKEDICKHAVDLEKEIKALQEQMSRLEEENLRLRRRVGVPDHAILGPDGAAGLDPSGIAIDTDALCRETAQGSERYRLSWAVPEQQGNGISPPRAQLVGRSAGERHALSWPRCFSLCTG